LLTEKFYLFVCLLYIAKKICCARWKTVSNASVGNTYLLNLYRSFIFYLPVKHAFAISLLKFLFGVKSLVKVQMLDKMLVGEANTHRNKKNETKSNSSHKLWFSGMKARRKRTCVEFRWVMC